MFKRFYAEIQGSTNVEEAASLFGARFPDSVCLDASVVRGASR